MLACFLRGVDLQRRCGGAMNAEPGGAGVPGGDAARLRVRGWQRTRPRQRAQSLRALARFSQTQADAATARRRAVRDLVLTWSTGWQPVPALRRSVAQYFGVATVSRMMRRLGCSQAPGPSSRPKASRRPRGRQRTGERTARWRGADHRGTNGNGCRTRNARNTTRPAHHSSRQPRQRPVPSRRRNRHGRGPAALRRWPPQDRHGSPFISPPPRQSAQVLRLLAVSHSATCRV